MRLINTETLKLEEFLNETVTPYAILSHTWNTDEVLFADIQSPEQAKFKSGFAKLHGFCEVAALAGYQHAWIDTCCIDKSSTVELSEAINSMFRWYRAAAMCFVYLADVHVGSSSTQFAECKWFTRGWTLQELLAPRRVVFFDADWVRLGSKSDLLEPIRRATGIDEDAIITLQRRNFCVAEKMSWAARRITTRPEDIAYSLLGLFDVTMPMLYGEGQKAFTRLQEEIIKKSDDRSIFAWAGPDAQYTGVLAQSPAFFQMLIPNITTNSRSSQLDSSYGLTNRGLEIELCLWPVTYKTYQAAITPLSGLNLSLQRTCIFLRWIPETGQYVRTRYMGKHIINEGESTTSDLVTLSTRKLEVTRPYVTRVVKIQHDLNYRALLQVSTENPQNTPSFRLDTAMPGEKASLRLVSAKTAGQWNAKHRLLKLDRDFFGTAAIFTFECSGSFGPMRSDAPRKLLVGYDFHFFPVCVIMTAQGVRRSKSIPSLRHKGKPSNDISKTCLEDITCLEENGWSSVANESLEEVEENTGIWAFKHNSYGQLYRTFGEDNWFIRVALEIEDDFEWRITIGEGQHSKPSRSWRPLYYPDNLRLAKMRKALRRASVDRYSDDELEEGETHNGGGGEI